MNLDTNSEKLICLLNENGFKAYAVGGCVRDFLLGREMGDIDIATSAMPDEVEKLLDENGIKCVETGIKHGTVTAVIDHTPYEITTFRKDGEYLDNRRPESVEFVDELKEDLARRDFTVNAIAYNENEGIIDIFGGKADIDNRLIRAVGNPDRRFNEDALRIMRALRFASVLGFEIEGKTRSSIVKNKDLLLNIANERIYSELIKLLLGNNAERILIDFRDVFAVILPELKPSFDFPQHSKWHIYDVYTHIVKSVCLAPKKDYLRLALLFHDVGKPFCKTTDISGQDHFKGHAHVSAEMAENALLRLRVSNEIRNNAVALIREHDKFITLKPSNIKRWLRTLGEQLTLDYIDFKIADALTHNLELTAVEIETLKEVRLKTVEIINSGEPYRVSDLKINGNDLSRLGFEGRKISDELNSLIDFVSENPECNTKKKLLEQAEADKKTRG